MARLSRQTSLGQPFPLSGWGVGLITIAIETEK